MTPPVVAFLQARMSSRRFPGKVLAPFRGRPLITHVLDAVGTALPAVPIVVLTSEEPSDDPLASYVASLNRPVFRGPLADVFQRFRGAIDRFPAEWLLRISGDSPLLDGRILRAVVDRARVAPATVDLVTTIFPRSFPSGTNVEVIRASTLRAIDAADLSEDDREHVTPFFYRNAERFGIVNVSSGAPALAATSVAVDTPADLARLEALADADIQALAAAIPL